MKYWSMTGLIPYMAPQDAGIMTSWVRGGCKMSDLPHHVAGPAVVNSVQRVMPLVTDKIGYAFDVHGSPRIVLLNNLNTFEFMALDRVSVMFDGEATLVCADALH